MARKRETIIASGEQPGQADESIGGLAPIGLGLGAIGASGFIPTKDGRRLWDHYLQGIRAIETGFPASILRTFRVSEALSPLETWSQIHLGQKLLQSRTVYSQYLQQALGQDVLEATITRTHGMFGEIRDQTGRAVGLAARIASGTQRGEGIADYYARAKGTYINEGFSISEGALRSRYFAEDIKVPYKDWLEGLPYAERQPHVPLIAMYKDEIDVFGKKVKVGAKMREAIARAEILSTYARAKASTTVGRLNTLLTKPFEIPIVGDILHRIPFIKSMAVAPGSHNAMVSGYIKKGLAAGAVGTGLFYYDYLRSQGGIAPVVAGTVGGAALGAFMGKTHGRPITLKGGAIGGALGLYTAVSPRFDKGLFHGAMSLVTDANLYRAKASSAVGLQESLRRQEEVTPGLISAKALVGFTGVGAVTAGLAGYGKMMYEAAKIKKTTGQPLEEIFETLRKNWYGEGGKNAKVGEFGKWLQAGIGKKIFKAPIIGKHLAKIRTPMGAGAVAGAAAWLAASTVLPILSGNFGAAVPVLNLLGTEETPEELQAIYSGEKEEPIRKGRWWEFGRSSAYEGGNIEYYRPHALARLATRAYQKGLWGDEEEKWEHDPTLHPLKALFGSDEWKYHYEEKYQYERPAPLTSTYGENIPFIGPAIAATFGKLLKPRKYVRPEEWMEGEDEYAYRAPRPEEEPVYELGGLKPGAPVSPDEASQVFNEMLYRRREATGLIGFASGAIESAATGREEIFPNKMTMATMGGETGPEYWLWKHLNIGGGMLTTEPIRRFLPHSRSYLETYNPIQNELPSWMPSDYFLDLKYGNPFDKIPEAEIRLPGPGYAALHPELEGVDPEDYPLSHRLKILGDVGMWSREYDATLGMARRRRGEMSEAEQRMIDTVQEQVQAKKKRKDFHEYRFRDEELSEMQLTISDVLGPKELLTKELGPMKVELQGIGATKDMQAAMETTSDRFLGKKITVTTPTLEARRYDMVTAGPRMKAVAMVDGMDYGRWLAEQGVAAEAPLQDEFEQLRYDVGDRVAGGMWESITRATETPAELMTPLSPASKFIRQRSAIEEYVQTEAVGTGSAFWDRPLSNFLGPAEEMGEYKLGDEGPAPVVEQRRAIQEYFDMLEWQKANERARAAEGDGDWSEAVMAKQSRGRTMFGMDPYAANPTELMRALPRRSRDFFQAFSDAKTEEDRQQIMSLVSQQERRVYLAQWMQEHAMALKAKEAARTATREDAVILNKILMARRSDGYEYDDAIEAQWKNETGGQVPFDEWLREKKSQQYFRTRALPGPDWIGWHPAVDLEDVKARYLKNEGLDNHDFDIWGDRMRSLSRKPYLSEEAIAQLTPSNQLQEEASLSSSAMVQNARNLRRSMRGGEANVSAMTIGSPGLSGYNINIQDKRRGLVDSMIQQLGN